jgi:excisionase family DNA binding protein
MLLTLDQAAAALTLTRRSLRALLARRALPFVRVTPRRLAILASDLEVYLRARRVDR